MPLVVPVALAVLGFGSIGFGAYEDLYAKPAPKKPAQPQAPEVQAAMTMLQTGKDPVAMEQLAAVLQSKGYPNVASELRARAAVLRQAAAQNKPPPPPPPPITVPAPPEAPAPSGVVVVAMVATQTDPLNIRSAPSTSAGIVGNAPKGSLVQVLNANAAPGWAQIKTSSGVTGFASSQYLQMPNAAVPNVPAPSPTMAAVATATVTGTGVNMRSSPSTTGGIVGQLNKPEIVTVLNWNAATSGGYSWAQIRKANGTTGYAAKNYLALNGPAPVAISGQELAFAVGALPHEEPKPAKCVAPSGCRLRVSPKPDSLFKTIVPNSGTVTVLKHHDGPKAERRSPGRGGWALVRYGRLTGWVPSEWLLS